MKCNCSKTFEIKLARQEDYAVFKKILDQGKHPAFIGKDVFKRNAQNGGALFYVFNNDIIAVSLINPKTGFLLVLNVLPEHRGHKLGAAIINFLMPNFARVIDYKVLWFKKQRYIPIGKPKQGQRHKTQIMVRTKLIKLTGKLKSVWKTK